MEIHFKPHPLHYFDQIFNLPEADIVYISAKGWGKNLPPNQSCNLLVWSQKKQLSSQAWYKLKFCPQKDPSFSCGLILVLSLTEVLRV